jgi:hypothetical protein
MKKLALGISLAVMAFSASAEVLTFEGIQYTNFPSNLNGYGLSNTNALGSSFPGYGALKWSPNFSVVEAANYNTRNNVTGAALGNGIAHGLQSGSYVAVNGGAATVSFEALTADGLFNFNSAYMGAAWYNGLTVAVTGYRDGAQIYSTTTGPLGYASALQTFNWTNVDKVTFASLDTGTVIDNQSTYNHAFVMDNLDVAAVPEPESYALMLAGLGLMGAVARRRKAKLS